VYSPSQGLSPPARRPWWAPAPDPVLEPISARRAYTEVLLVFAAFFLAGVVSAGLLLGGRYHDPLQNGSWSDYVPAMIDALALTGLAVAVVLLLSARRGVTPRALGLTLPRGANGRLAAGVTTRILAWGIFAQVLGGVINAILQTGHLPTSQPNGAELLFSVFDSVQAGVVEELVVLGFVVVTLRQAGRPWWEVTTVALVLRCSYHIYYGPGVFGILVWAALFYWIYLRFRSLILLMICHAGWDTVGFLAQRWPAVSVGAALIGIAICIAGPITWLAERNAAPAGRWSPAGTGSYAASGAIPPAGNWSPVARGTSPPGAGTSAAGPGTGAGWWGPDGSQQVAPPGWQPDPSGVHYWRWWDGHCWTEYVSGP
jgi:hypothetical protein